MYHIYESLTFVVYAQTNLVIYYIYTHQSTLLRTYNLSHTVNFAARIQNSLRTAIDNIFIESARLGSSHTSPIVSGLSNRYVQFLIVGNITTKEN